MMPNRRISPECRQMLVASLALTAVVSVAPAADSLQAAWDVLDEAVRREQILGASAMITRHGKPVAVRSFGVRDLKTSRPFADDTVCWVASLTKPITAAAAMTLVDEGRLRLDDAVEKYLPEFADQPVGNGPHVPVTVRQLMCHTSGIPAKVPLRPRFFFTQSWYSRDLAEIAAAIAIQPLEFKPGRQVRYSNAAPYVLGRLIEVRTGQPFGEYVQRRIFDPLRMTDSGFEVSRENVERTAVVYRREDNSLVEYCRYDPDWTVRMTMPDGGVFSTPRDMARFVNSFLAAERSVLTREAADSMLTGQSDGYGLGWILDEPNQFSHWGSSGTLMWGDRTSGVAGVLFIQIQDRKRIEPIHDRFRQAVTRAFPRP
jgi:CubicO group peptidase (beta-lactamase class C family)